MIVKLLTEHHLEFLSLREAAQDRLNLQMSKCHIVGNLMPRLNFHLTCMNLSDGLLVCNDWMMDRMQYRWTQGVKTLFTQCDATSFPDLYLSEEVRACSASQEIMPFITLV